MALKPPPVTHRTRAPDRDARRAFAYTELFAWNWQWTRVINHSLNIFMRPSQPSATNVFSPCFLCSSFELLGDAWRQECGAGLLKSARWQMRGGGWWSGGLEVPMGLKSATPVTLQIMWLASCKFKRAMESTVSRP